MRNRIQTGAQVGDTVRLSRFLVVGHTDKTRWYTTSRAPVFLKALAETTLERIQDEPAYLAFSPVGRLLYL